MFVSVLSQQDQVHSSHSQAETEELQDVAQGVSFFHEVSPDVGAYVHEVPCHEGDEVNLHGFADLPQAQTDDNSNEGSEVHEGVAEDGLTVSKSALQQDSHMPHFARYLVGEDSHHDGDELSALPRRESDPNGKAIEKVVDERGDEYEVP
jgi:hypothetical protein